MARSAFARATVHVIHRGQVIVYEAEGLEEFHRGKPALTTPPFRSYPLVKPTPPRQQGPSRFLPPPMSA